MPSGYQRSVVGIVLAGGGSRRFGSDKLAAELDGRPLVLHAVGALRAVHGLDEVVVVGPPLEVDPGWLPAVEAAGARIVRDEESSAGPLAGLANGLRGLPPAGAAIVVGGDMPRLDPVVLGDLVGEILNGPGVDTAFLVSDGRNHPLPLAVAVGPALEVAGDLLKRGERSLRSFLEAFDRRGASPPFDPRSLADVDTPDDLAALRPARAASGPGTGSS
jgi:molybdopterin-guanine dinucleotide biosynthesis protein A